MLLIRQSDTQFFNLTNCPSDSHRPKWLGEHPPACSTVWPSAVWAGWCWRRWRNRRTWLGLRCWGSLVRSRPSAAGRLLHHQPQHGADVWHTQQDMCWLFKMFLYYCDSQWDIWIVLLLFICHVILIFTFFLMYSGAEHCVRERSPPPRATYGWTHYACASVVPAADTCGPISLLIQEKLSLINHPITLKCIVWHQPIDLGWSQGREENRLSNCLCMQ